MRSVDFYEFVGVLVPGVVLLGGSTALGVLPDLTVFGNQAAAALVFLVVAYVAGHLVAAIGNGVEDADAMALRYVYPNGGDFVAVIDGGRQADAELLVQTVRNYYGRSYVDLVVSTHPDMDHIAGLRSLIDLIEVRRVWVHDPSRHTVASALNNTKRRAATSSYEAKAIVKSLDDASDFVKRLDQLGIPRHEPFTGEQCGPLLVLGPSRDFYGSMLSQVAADDGFVNLIKMAQFQETHLETDLEAQSGYAIDENNETSPINNTSVLVWTEDAERSFLFTGDAGVQALEDAQHSYNYGNVHWLDVPHHGSRRNLSSNLVEYLKPKVAFVSAKGSVKHPSKAVVNALKRAGAEVYSTHKSGRIHHHSGDGVDRREGWVSAVPL